MNPITPPLVSLILSAGLLLFVWWLDLGAPLQPLLMLLFKHKDVVKPEGLYLRRYYVLRTPWFRVFLHWLARDDDDRDPHDHPWSFWTLVLRGGYCDERWCRFMATKFNGHRDVQEPLRVLDDEEPMRPGTLRFREAEHTHRVRDTKPNTWTLIVASPVKRMWGFRDATWAFHPAPEYLGDAYDASID